MSRERDRLIEELAGSAAPVRRVAPAAVRAAGWLLVTAIVAAVAISRLSPPGGLALRLTNGWNYLELAATAATGIAAIFAAFNMGVPGSSPRWHWWPLLPLGLWMAASVAGITAAGGPMGAMEDSADCFRFVLAASAPMAAAVLLALRRTRALHPWRTAFTAGIGVASLAAFLLAFCHPFALGMADFAVHLVAMLIAASVVTLAGGPLLAIRHER